ncbi:hypothetical protein KRMM14A1259_42640 [Krasilnikovia sp. MM14-A1259]
MAGFCLCGLGAVPIVALLDYTQRQGDAFGTPVEAADAYLLQLNLNLAAVGGELDEVGLSRALDADRRDELLKQWEGLRTEIGRTDPPPSKLTWSSFQSTSQGGETVTVTVPVSAQWSGGTATSYKSEPHPWTFTARHQDGGWRLSAVQPYPWCGGYVDQAHCH